MARIRTIKPEFPQSETMGRLSRDARLLFIQLWTIADDEGRTRASSRMLASLLYPYDDDARDLMEGWLTELEQASCIRRYEVEGSRYLEITNWLKHQKIDKPSKSRLPEFVDGSRPLAKPREASPTDLGPRTVDHGPSEANASAAEAPPDPRGELFKRGLSTLTSLTGKPESSCRRLLGLWLKDCRDEAIHVLAAIDEAAVDRPADPVPWIAARLKPKSNPGNTYAKAAPNGLAATLRTLKQSIADDDGGQVRGGAPPRLLSHG